MGNQYNRIAAGMDAIKYFHDFDGSFGIEVTCWFICQNQRRAVYQCPGNSYTLALTTTQFIWFVVAAVLQANFTNYIHRHFSPEFLWYSCINKGKGNIFGSVSRGNKLNCWNTKPISLFRISARLSSAILLASCH